MFLYEIKAASFAHQLNELASADIDGDLEKAAGEISKATGAGQDDETAGMGGDDFGAAPNPEAGASPMQMGDEGDELATDDPLASTETDEEEDEMLDLAWGLTPTSRLGCQIVLTEALDGLVVSLPAETHNLLDG